MKVFFGCFITHERAEKLRASWKGAPDELESYLEGYAQGVMVRPPDASLDLQGDVHLPANCCVSETWLLDQLARISDVKSVIKFTRASHDREKKIVGMLYDLGEYDPRTRVFDDRSTAKVVVSVKPDQECAVAGDVPVQDPRNLSNIDKNVVIGRLRDTLRAVGGMFMPAPRLENAVGVLECCDHVRFLKVVEALTNACLGEAEPGLTAPGELA